MIRVLLAFALACLIPLGLASAADAQPSASPRRIGVLFVIFSPESREAQAFREGLRDAGYAEGRDVVFEWRSADGDYKKVPGLAADLVRRKVDVIVVDTTPATRAVKRTTSTIPIVMATVGDPVGSGLVASLAHPGGNVTGLSMMATEVSVKKLQLLKEAIPRVARVSVLWNPDNPSHSEAIEDLKAVAPSLSIELRFVSARTRPRIGIAHHAADGVNAYGLVVGRLAAHEQRSVLGLRPFVADIGFQRFAGHRGQRLDVLTA